MTPRFLFICTAILIKHPRSELRGIDRVGWIKRQRRVSATNPVDSRYALNPPYKNLTQQAAANRTRKD
jgi:hypothetical protein